MSFKLGLSEFGLIWSYASSTDLMYSAKLSASFGSRFFLILLSHVAMSLFLPDLGADLLSGRSFESGLKVLSVDSFCLFVDGSSFGDSAGSEAEFGRFLGEIVEEDAAFSSFS